MDTHAASVFLDGARALKIKRAVRFPYLDYSTLEKRKAACDEEMKVNRKFAPRIYRRVVPITQSAQGSLEIGIQRTGFGEVIDGLTLVKAGHFNGEFARCAVSIDVKRALCSLWGRDATAGKPRCRIA